MSLTMAGSWSGYQALEFRVKHDSHAGVFVVANDSRVYTIAHSHEHTAGSRPTLTSTLALHQFPNFNFFLLFGLKSIFFLGPANRM